jgi:hypothetical protein
MLFSNRLKQANAPFKVPSNQQLPSTSQHNNIYNIKQKRNIAPQSTIHKRTMPQYGMQ